MTNAKRIIPFLITLLFLGSSGLLAETTFEVRSNAFFPAKHRFRNVYGHCQSSFGAEASTDFCYCLNLWANFDQMNKKGHVRGCGDSKIHLITFSMGLKKVWCFNNFLPYLGLGPTIANVRIRNHLNGFSTYSNKTSIGVVAKSGVYVPVRTNVFFDFFADYYYQPVHYYKTTNCGGLRIGLGLGMAFYP